MPPGNAAQHSGEHAPTHFYYGLNARTGSVLVGLNRQDVATEIAGELFCWGPPSRQLPYTLEAASEALLQPRTTAILRRVEQYLGLLHNVLKNADVHRELTPINRTQRGRGLTGMMVEMRGLPDWSNQIYQHQWFTPTADPNVPYTPYLHATDRGWWVGQTGIDDAHLYSYTNDKPLMGPIGWDEKEAIHTAVEMVHQPVDVAETLRKLQHPEQTSAWEANDWLNSEWRAKTKEAMLVAADMRIELLVVAQQWASAYGHSIRNSVWPAEHLVYLQDFPLPPNMMEAPAPLSVGVNITKVLAQSPASTHPLMLSSIAERVAAMGATLYRIECDLDRALTTTYMVSNSRFSRLGVFPVWAHRGSSPISPQLINKLRSGTVSALNTSSKEWVVCA